MPLKIAYIVQPTFMTPNTLSREQKPNEIMIQGARGFYFLHKEGTRCWVGEYFGLEDIKDVTFYTRKDDAIKGCKERLA